VANIVDNAPENAFSAAHVFVNSRMETLKKPTMCLLRIPNPYGEVKTLEEEWEEEGEEGTEEEEWEEEEW